MAYQNWNLVFEAIRAEKINNALKAISTYSAALKTGVSADGQPVTEQDKAFLTRMIPVQHHVIAEAKAMKFRPEEW